VSDRAYLDAVASHLADDGWATETNRVREDTVVVAGNRETGDGPESRLGGGAAGDADRATEEQVTYLLKTASDREPDEVLVAARDGATEDARALADEYSVPVLDGDAVGFVPPESATEGAGSAGDADASEGAGATSDAQDGATDAPDASNDVHDTPDATGESPDDATSAGGSASDAAGASETGDASPESTDAPPADDDASPSPVSASTATDWAGASDGDASSGDSGNPGNARPQREPGGAPEPRHRSDGWSRRDAVKLGGVAALAAGGWVAYDRVIDSGPEGPEAVVRAFYGAIDDGNVARARELIHENGEPIDAATVRETSVEIVSLERVETDRADAAQFRITLRVDGSYTEEAVVGLRKSADGEWRMVTV